MTENHQLSSIIPIRSVQFAKCHLEILNDIFLFRIVAKNGHKKFGLNAISWGEATNKEKSKTRARVEHVFGFMPACW